MSRDQETIGYIAPSPSTARANFRCSRQHYRRSSACIYPSYFPTTGLEVPHFFPAQHLHFDGSVDRFGGLQTPGIPSVRSPLGHELKGTLITAYIDTVSRSDISDSLMNHFRRVWRTLPRAPQITRESQRQTQEMQDVVAEEHRYKTTGQHQPL